MFGKYRAVLTVAVAILFFGLSTKALMATYQAVKMAVTLPPTVRTLSSGVPYAPLLNLVAGAPHDPNNHHVVGGHRSDVAPRWAGGVSRTSFSLISKTLTTGTMLHHIIFHSELILIRHSCPLSQLPTTIYPFVCCSQKRA